MADSSKQPLDFSELAVGSKPSEMLSASIYQPSPKWDDRVAHNMSDSFGMLGGLSVSQMKAVLNLGPRTGDKSFASELSLSVTNIASLIYPTLPENTMFSSGAMGKPVQYADTTQGSIFAHSTPFRTAQPKQGAKPGQDLLSDQTTWHQGVSLATVSGLTELDKGKVPLVPPVIEKWVDSGKEPPVRHKGPKKGQDLESGLDSSDEEEAMRLLLTLSVQLQLVLDCFPIISKELTQKCLQLYVVKHLQLLAARGQHVFRLDLTESMKLFTWTFELELNEYIKCKLACRTATLTATLPELVDYNTLLHQHKPDIAEAMDILNAYQQDYERWQNAA
ncbi:hypothetical protein C0992_000557 [Termitomyces sp. T32_za158]|nr:hypothetical protein C0992_000557 [Termitomyces sp. T32_za158]